MSARKARAQSPMFTVSGSALRAALIASASLSEARTYLRSVRFIVRDQKGTCIGTDGKLIWASRFDAPDCPDLDASIPAYALRDLRLQRRPYLISISTLAKTFALTPPAGPIRTGSLVEGPNGATELYQWPMATFTDTPAAPHCYVQPALLARLHRCAEAMGYRTPAMATRRGMVLVNYTDDAFGAVMGINASQTLDAKVPDWARTAPPKPAARSAGRKAA